MTAPLRPVATFTAPELARSPAASSAEPADFGDVFRRMLGDASNLESNAQATIEAFLRGDPVDLHQVMAASEEASIALELLVEIRNKLTDAYRSVVNLT